MTDKTRRPQGDVPAGISRRRFMKRVAATGAGIAAATGLDPLTISRALADSKLTGPLLISNWPYYIGKTTVADFQKQFGIEAKYVEDINDNDSLFGKIAGPLQMGQNPSRDIIVPTDYMVGRLIQLGWLDKFSHDEVPNAKNIQPSLAHPSWDPDRNYSLPWATYLTGLAYNVKKTGRDLTSINEIFDPAFKGHVGMLSQMRDTLALVFLGMGVDPEKATYADAEAAVKKLKDNVANGQIRQFYGNDYGAALSRGDIWVAFAWSGDIVQLQADNPDLRFVFTKEGLYRSDDNMVMPLKPEHRDAALAWMNYIYDPQVYAKMVPDMQYISPVVGTEPYVKDLAPDLLKNPLVYPTADDFKQMHEFVLLSAEEDQKWSSLFAEAMGH